MAGANVVGSAIWEMGVDSGGFSAGMALVSRELSKIIGEMGTATAAAKGFSVALAALGAAALGVASTSVMTAARTETLGVAMDAVTKATGNSTRAVKEQEDALKKQGIATQEARTMLTRFMQANLDVADASKIARVAQDLAVIGDMNSSDAAETLTQAISSQNVMLLKQFGITTSADQIFESYAQTLKKTSEQLTDTEKRQAFVNKILQEGEKVTGVYERAMDTAGKKLGSMTRYIQEAQNAIGAVFLPTFNRMIDAVTDFLEKITPENVQKFMRAIEEWSPVIIGVIVAALLPLIAALKTMAVAAALAIAPLLPFIAVGAAVGLAFKVITDQVFGLNSGLTVLIATVQVVMALLVGLFRTFNALMNLQFGEIKNIVYDTVGSISGAVSTAQQKITNNVKGSQDEQVNAVEDGARRQEEITKELSAKQTKQLADETERFIDEQAKRKKSFEESLADMIFAHLDKVADIKKDLAEETKEFTANMAERVVEFNESMEEMRKDHLEKVSDIKADLKELNEDFEKSNEERQRDTNKLLATETKDYDKKVSEIQLQIDKETNKGKNASQTRLAILREQLAEETEQYKEKVISINEENDIELAKATDTYNKKLIALNEELAAEEASYLLSVQKKTAEEDKETARLTAQNEARVTELSESLAEEQSILQAHQSLVDSIKDTARENDIARLIRQNAEENAEAEKQHNKRMVDITNQATSEGQQSISAYTSGVNTTRGGVAGVMSSIGNEAGKMLKDSASSSAREAGRSMVDNFINSVRSWFSSAGNWLVNAISFPMNSLMRNLGIPGFAEGVKGFGGGLALVGENGPELVNLPRGADVIPNSVAFGGGASKGKELNQTIYITIDKVGGMQDVQALGRELGFRASMMP